MKILFVTNGFTESVFPLAGSLSVKHDTTVLFLANRKFFKKEYDLDITERNSGFIKRDFLGLQRFLENHSRIIAASKIDIFLMSSRMFSRRYFVNDIIFYIRVFRYIRKLKPDLINLVGHADYYYRLLNCFPKYSKLVYTLHEVSISRIIEGVNDNKYLRYLYKSDNPILFHSAYLRNHFITISGKAPSYSLVFPLGLFNHYLYLESVPVTEVESITNRFILLNYGYLRPYKGYNSFLEVAKKFLPFNDVIFLIAGEGDLPINLFPLPSNVIFVNRFLKETEIAFLHRKSMVTFLPYLAASQSGVVMSSLAFGRPVVATDVGAFSEYIQNYSNGLLVEPNNVDDMFNKLFYFYEKFKNSDGSHIYFSCDNSLIKSWDELSELYLKFVSSIP